MSVGVGLVGPEAAERVCALVHAAFDARPPLDPPAPALAETPASVARALAAHGGIVLTLDGEPAAALLLDDVDPSGTTLTLRRVSVAPAFQHTGVARHLVAHAEEVALDRGYDEVDLAARAELPATVAFWQHLGYHEISREGTTLRLVKVLPVRLVAENAEATAAFGEQLAGVLRAGDLLVLAGDLGAGKTTFTQGLGAGMRVRGAVTSPTFVIARVHPSLVGGPALVHVDAYRVGSALELDDLDLDASLEESVTVVEWGSGVAEGLSATRLDVELVRSSGADTSQARELTLTPVGARWSGAGLRTALGVDTWGWRG